MQAIVNLKSVIGPAIQKPRDFVLHPPGSMDRITFNTADDGILAGFVAAIRQHVGNGERFAWVEMDNDLSGLFRAVPLADIISCDDFGCDRRDAAADNTGRRPYLCDFSGALSDALKTVNQGG